jgi:TolB-like protein
MLRKVLGERAPAKQYIETVPTRGYRFGGPIIRTGAHPKTAEFEGGRPIATAPRVITAVSVIPFRNLSADPEQEYFVDGVTDAVIGAVATIKGLRDISRMSSMRFKTSSAGCTRRTPSAPEAAYSRRSR